MEWISIKDRLPEEDVWIIGANLKRVEFGIWLGDKMGFQLPHRNYLNLTITHWMPKPNPPEE